MVVAHDRPIATQLETWDTDHRVRVRVREGEGKLEKVGMTEKNKAEKGKDRVGIVLEVTSDCVGTGFLNCFGEGFLLSHFGGTLICNDMMVRRVGIHLTQSRRCAEVNQRRTEIVTWREGGVSNMSCTHGMLCCGTNGMIGCDMSGFRRRAEVNQRRTEIVTWREGGVSNMSCTHGMLCCGTNGMIGCDMSGFRRRAEVNQRRTEFIAWREKRMRHDRL